MAFQMQQYFCRHYPLEAPLSLSEFVDVQPSQHLSFAAALLLAPLRKHCFI
jgi:hypothetical protein